MKNVYLYLCIIVLTSVCSHSQIKFNTNDNITSLNSSITSGREITITGESTLLETEDYISTNISTLTFIDLQIHSGHSNFSTEIYFDNNCTLGLDPGYDAMIWGGTAPSNFSIYTHLVEDNTGIDIALQAVGSSDINDVTIPVGVNANAEQQLTFSISNMSNIPNDINIHLDDTVANTSTLLNVENYVFTPANHLSGTGRFYIRFTNTTLSTTNNNLDHLKIISNQRTKTIDIIGDLQQESNVTLFDIQGHIVLSTVLNGRTLKQSIAVDTLNPGVYVVQLNHSNQNKTQKVIIN